MKKTLLIVAMLTAVVMAKAQIPNAGFENWTTGNPNSWGTFDNLLTGLGVTGTTLETQVSPGHSGTSACQLKSQTIAALGQILPGLICSGPVTYGTGVSLGAMPYNQNPTAYDFWYKFTPVNGDTALTQVLFTKWNTGTNSRDTIGGAYSYIIGAQATFTNMSLPITWIGAGAPDSIQMVFISSAGTAQANTTLIVDDINMSLVTGIKEPFMLNNYSVFPNPASNVINFVTKDDKASKVQIYDLTGRMVAEEKFQDKKVVVEGLIVVVMVVEMVESEKQKFSNSAY